MTKIERINRVIGSEVKAIRKAHKIRQTQLCKVLGIDQSALSRVETGKQQLTAAQWVLFSMHLAVPYDYLAHVVRERL